MRLGSLLGTTGPLLLGEKAVRLCDGGVEDRQPLEGINRKENGRADRSVDLLLVVALADRMQQGSLVKVSQLEQVAHSIY